MSDNTLLNPGNGGDVIRTLDKTGTGVPKTQVIALDVGGGDGTQEVIASLNKPVPILDAVGTLEAILLELKVISSLLVSLSQPRADDPEQIRTDLNLSSY
jgi:hypothetical protein